MNKNVTFGGTELFPRRYVGGDDLGGKSYTLEIESIAIEEMHDLRTHETKKQPVLYFKNAKHGFVLRKHFAQSIAEALGITEAEKWPGHKIMIYPFQTQLGTGVRAKTAGTKLDEPPATLSSRENDEDA